MKKRGMSIGGILLALLLFVRLNAAAEPDPVQELVARGVLAGYEDGALQLDAYVTRAEFAKMLMTALGAELLEEKEQVFPDVPDTHWAFGCIMDAAERGIIVGDEHNYFQPDAMVTYEQAVKMVVAAINRYGQYDYPAGYVRTGMDAGYTEHVEALIGEPITRQDAVHLIYNAYSALEQAEKNTVFFGYSDSSIPVFGNGGSGGGSSSGGSVGGGGNLAAGVPPFAEMPVHVAGEGYAPMDETIFKKVIDAPVSTFSIDVDTASYSNMRRFLLSGMLPPEGAVRTEELINYFEYDRPETTETAPFSVAAEVHACPWNAQNRLVMLSFHGNALEQELRGRSNLVFLIDTSGSMSSPNKLPLVVKAMELLLETLDERDTVALVTYAGTAGVALEPTPASEKEKIMAALRNLRAGGSTAGSAGINLAYEAAERYQIDGNNRVILCTDGDFNVGISNTAMLEQLISQKRDSGIYLSVLGFGMGNYKDHRMETLADKGNGNYAYIDSLKEAKKVLVDDMTKTLYTVAEDVKLQVEFNPEVVSEYRLVGYENRMLEREDFENDAVDAGEMGAGHQVTAFYELKPADGALPVDGLRYQDLQSTGSDELLFLKVRYKNPTEQESRLLEFPVANMETAEKSNQYQFAAAVAAFGMLLNDSEYKGDASYEMVLETARRTKGEDRFGLRAEFTQLVDLAKYLSAHPETADKKND